MGLPLSSNCLSGLRADNLLAYLAALGTLRSLTLHSPQLQPRLAWCLDDGCWRPAIQLPEQLTEDDIASRLFEHLQGKDQEPQFLMMLPDTEIAPRDLTIPGYVFSRVALAAAEQATPDNRAWADFCCAYGTEAYSEEEAIQNTSLRTMSGAGHQHFLESIRRLALRPVDDTQKRGSLKNQMNRTEKEIGDGTTKDQFRRALFGPWDYSDSGPAMRWDPRDDRRYALRADDPSGSKVDPIRTMRGANRLAVEALPLFSTFPAANGARTVGFRRHDGSNVITCPVWQDGLQLDTVRSVLNHPSLEHPLENRSDLAVIRIREVFQSTRLITGRMVNFTPGKPICGGVWQQPTVERATPR